MTSTAVAMNPATASAIHIVTLRMPQHLKRFSPGITVGIVDSTKMSGRGR